MGVAVEVILEGFISGIESFHIIYFYFHLSITQKINRISVLHREAIKLLDACRIKRCDNLYSGEETLMRHHLPYARFSSRMCTCAVYSKTYCFVYL